MKKLLTLNSVLFILLLSGCGVKAPDQDVILESVSSFGLNTISEGNIPDYCGEPINLEIRSAEITRQQTEDKSNTTYCTISLSNDSLEASLDCILYYDLFDDKRWYPEQYRIESYTLNPLEGVDEELAAEYLAEALNAENKEIDGGYARDTYIYPSNYHLDLTSHETDLDAMKDILTFDYEKESEICKESGTVSIHYAFDTASGLWQYETIDDSQIQYEYHPEGQWRFDIYTYFVRLYITDMDYTNCTATIYSKGAAWHEAADNGELDHMETVSFTITSEGIEFSALQVPERDYSIILLLKKDNMYYRTTDSEVFFPVSFKREI